MFPSTRFMPCPPWPGTPRRRNALAVWWLALGFWLTMALAAPAQATPVPVPPYSARVLDLSGALDGAHIASLNEQILALEADTRAAVVVFMLPTTGEEAIEQYATRVFDAWKLGDTERDDGILILVATQDRRMRIEVGQGLEGTVPDILAGRIIDEQMKPRFRSDDYAGGLEAAINRIGATVRGDVQAEVDAEQRHGVTPFGWAFLATLLCSFVIGLLRAQRSWNGSWNGNGQIKKRWPLTLGALATAPLVAGAVLANPAMAGMLLSFPAPLAFAVGFGCGRSRGVRIGLGGVALVVGLLVGIAYAVGADKFWWGFLYAVVGGAGCLLLTMIALGMRMVWQRSVREFCVRGAVVLGIVGYVGFKNLTGPAGSILSDGDAWLPVAVSAAISMLFAFFPGTSSRGGRGGRSSRGGSSGGSASSRSSSSSSSRSSSGGSSSGGGASGNW